MELVNGATLLDITFSLALFPAASVAAVFSTVIFPYIYASLKSHKVYSFRFDLTISIACSS